MVYFATPLLLPFLLLFDTFFDVIMYYSFLLFVLAICSWLLFIIFLIFWIHNTARDHKDHKAEVQARQPKEHYKDEQWLKMQYYDRRRSIQEIANHENVSMMQIEEAIKKLDLP